MGGDPTPPAVSPWVWETPDNFGNIIRITAMFDDVTRVMSGVTTFRDAACQWTQIIIDPQPDGSFLRAIAVPAGTTNVTAAQLASQGINVIEDILVHSITAAP